MVEGESWFSWLLFRLDDLVLFVLEKEVETEDLRCGASEKMVFSELRAMLGQSCFLFFSFLIYIFTC